MLPGIRRLTGWFSGNLQIRFAFAAANDLDDGGRRFGVGTGILVLVGLGKQLEQFGFDFLSFILVHQSFYLYFLLGRSVMGLPRCKLLRPVKPVTGVTRPSARTRFVYRQGQRDYSGGRKSEPVPDLRCLFVGLPGHGSGGMDPRKFLRMAALGLDEKSKQSLDMDVHHVPAVHLCLPHENRHPAAGL
jgi:hypothetical protein